MKTHLISLFTLARPHVSTARRTLPSGSR
jgi:hypothetical protein